MTTEEVLLLLSNVIAERSYFSFNVQSWNGTEEELHKFQYHLNILNKVGDIELVITPILSGDRPNLGDEKWLVKKITPQGHMKLAGKIPMVFNP